MKAFRVTVTTPTAIIKFNAIAKSSAAVDSNAREPFGDLPVGVTVVAL